MRLLNSFLEFFFRPLLPHNLNLLCKDGYRLCHSAAQYKNPSGNFFQEGLACSGRESNPYGHFCPRDFLATLAFTQAGFILNAKPL